jgi:RNA polymerase sigma factor (sigma-70 family)
MRNSPARAVIERLRKAVLRTDGGDVTDGQLLQRFIEARDQVAFEALVRRHGPMVLGVCRRLLGHAHDAEDAFQAAFLVLARKAASVVPREAVGNWLYGVAYHTALKAQAAAARRRAKEKQVTVMPEPQAAPEDRWQDWLPLLDRELSRLPDHYRTPVVLCDLAGQARKDVALRLKIPEGTLSSRLTTARRMLARRLRQHGLVVGGGALAGALSEGATAACVPAALVVSTVKAATLFAAGGAAALTPAPAAALAEGVVKGMFLSRLKIATAIMLAAFGLGAMVTGPAYRAVAGGGAGAQETHQHPHGGAPAKAAQPADGARAQPDVKGSGHAVTRKMDFADFTTVEVSNVFRVEITRADSFATAVTADDNLFPYIKVTKEGSTLRIALDASQKSVWATTLKASIAMPALEGVSLSRASQATLKGFKSAKGFKASVTGACRLDGDIEAGQVDLDVVEAGTVTLKGAARGARISASRACSLFLDDLALDRAEVTLKDASSATVSVKAKLDYDLSTACRLEYRGDPTVGKHELSGGSIASRVSSDHAKNEGRPKLGFPHDAGALPDHLRALHEHLREVHANSGQLKGMHEFGPAAAGGVAPASPMRVSVGDKVSDFTLRTLDGKEVKLSELQKDARRTKKGDVVLSFWCSFCPSCRRVEHALDKLAKDYEGRALVIALDASAGETAEKARAAAKKEGLTLTIALDPDGHTADVFATEATTTTVVIDGEGVLRYCGRFSDGDRAYAEDALKAVLAGREVDVKMTRHDGCRIIRK